MVNQQFAKNITNRKRPDAQEQTKAKKKRTDEALSLSQNGFQYEGNIIERESYHNFRVDEPIKRVVPGKRSYAETVSYGKKIVVFGDSHMRRIDRRKLIGSVKPKTQVKFFNGVKSEQLEYYVIPTIKEQNPDVVIIHVGSNNVNYILFLGKLRKIL